MEFDFTPEQVRFRMEIRKFLQEVLVHPNPLRTPEEHDPTFYRALAERGYIGMQWPTAYGGRGRTHVDMAIFYEEMAYANAPLGRYTGSVVFVGESLIAYGSAEQCATYLPRIARGEMTCCWCLSEPDAGSDAAALRTRAVPVENGGSAGFLLEGQKIFTSGAHLADLALVAARTNPDVPKHQGISLFLVPMHQPGVRVTPLWTIGGWRVNQVFFDRVELPASALVGERDRGWQQIRITLGLERSAIGKVGLLMRVFDHLIAHEQAAVSTFRARLWDIKAEIEALRWMAFEVAWRQDRGEAPEALASAGKLRASELVVALSELGMEMAAENGAERGAEGAFDGEMEFLYRNIPFYLNGGGSPDMQRIVVARRGLGLPRG